MNKILYISPFNIYPPSNGGGRYIYNYIKKLSQKDEVIFVGLKTQERIPLNKSSQQYNLFDDNFKKYINLISYWKIFLISKREKPKLIIVSMPYQALYAVIISRLLGIDCFLHEQNIEFQRFKRMGKWWWPLMYMYEYTIYVLVKKILSISETDLQNIVKYFKIPKEKLKYTPYQVDTSVFKPDINARKKIREQLRLGKNKIVLFFGPLDYKPNKDAVEIIINKLAPSVYKKHISAKFLIVGKFPPNQITSPNIVFTGYVDKIEDYINASDVVIVPLLSGGGVRTKILESLSCNIPVISTSLGAEGIDVTQNRNLVICDDLNLFKDHIYDICF